jgi:EpsI family protein
MRNRRELLMGLGCVAAVGTAEVLRPRRLLSFMPPGRKLSDLVPHTLPGFAEGGTGDIVIPRTAGSLSSTLYSDELGRIFHPDGQPDTSIMMLIAYGPAQTETLQLHRPEVCYPAIGFDIVGRRDLVLSCGPFGQVPAVGLTAAQEGRVEDIVYWTRVGNALPRDSLEQTFARFRQSVAGDIGDGTLARASAVRVGNVPQFDIVSKFMEALIMGVSPAGRRALIGR